MPYLGELTYAVDAVPALSSNYIWIIRYPEVGAIIVDPGESQPVLDYLQAHKVSPFAILITHHHPDHCGGIIDITARYDIPVYGPAQEEQMIDGLTHPVQDQQTFTVEELDLTFEVMAVPGHTRGHIAYFNSPWLFCGDTLFSAGCGRLFEGSAHQLYHSLQYLATLSHETQVYCGHEYTAANLSFARQVEPHNEHIVNYQKRVHTIREQGEPTLPSTIGLERSVNPFLRCLDSGIIKAAQSQNPQLDTQDPVAIFKTLRDWKDAFKIGQ